MARKDGDFGQLSHCYSHAEHSAYNWQAFYDQRLAPDDLMMA